jgi:hypothetical protein
MNKVVRQNYPVELLPLDLRNVVGSARTVTVTLQPDDDHRLSGAEALAAMKAARDRMLVAEPVDAAARIRKLRDEWDD